MSRKREQQRIRTAQPRNGATQLLQKQLSGTIDQHPLHAEAARRGCGGEIARVDGRRMQPSGGAARHSGVQRDPTHPSTSMIATGQLLACGTLVSCRAGTVSGSGALPGVSV